MLRAQMLSFSYYGPQSPKKALSGISFHIKKGELTVILGRNGSGKSTLARHLNCLLPLQQGSLSVSGLDAGDSRNTRQIRRLCGMVFQNPDNQFVSSVCEEDIAFGLRNYGVSEDKIPELVSQALSRVGLEGFEKRAPQFLSGGQKQRLAIAGVLALEPEIVVLDEAGSMLDGEGRRELSKTVDCLRLEGKTVVLISHRSEDAAQADRVLLMSGGRLTADGAPREILPDRELLASAGLMAPLAVRSYYALRQQGISLGRCPLSCRELTEEVCRLL